MTKWYNVSAISLMICLCVCMYAQWFKNRGHVDISKLNDALFIFLLCVTRICLLIKFKCEIFQTKIIKFYFI